MRCTMQSFVRWRLAFFHKFPGVLGGVENEFHYIDDMHFIGICVKKKLQKGCSVTVQGFRQHIVHTAVVLLSTSSPLLLLCWCIFDDDPVFVTATTVYHCTSGYF